jgi:hypothetical protein
MKPAEMPVYFPNRKTRELLKKKTFKESVLISCLPQSHPSTFTEHADNAQTAPR